MIISVDSYMFRPPTVAIFRELFLKDILRSKSKQFTNIKCFEFDVKVLKIYVTI